MATSGGHRGGGGHGGRGRRPRNLALKGAAVDERDRIEIPWWVSGSCPGPNVMAEFLERRLPPAQHHRVLDHIKDCEPCWDLFSSIAQCLFNLDALDFGGEELVAQAEAAASASQPKAPGADLPATDAEPRAPVTTQKPAASARRHERPRLARLAARIAVHVAIAGTALAIGWWLPTRDPRALLTATVASERPFASRIGGIPWSPHAPRLRNATVEGGLTLTRGVVSYLAAAELRSEDDQATSANELGAIGAAQLLGGRVGPAVETLTRAVANDPESPELLSDYGAALLARAEGATDLDFDEEPRPGREERDADLPAALEAIERALEKSPRLPEALFNRALALERLHLTATAKKAWERYLEVDGRSAWATEARERLAAIEVPVIADPRRVRADIAAAASYGDRERLAELVQAQRHLARQAAQEDLLPGWGESFLAGQMTEADSALEGARAIGDEWEAQTTDASIRLAVAEIERVSETSRRQLAAAYQALGEGARAFATLDLPAATTAADRALIGLPHDSPGLPWARALRLGCTFYESGDMEREAGALLRDPRTDFASRGRALWLLGLWHGKHGESTRSLAEYREGLTAYGRVQERAPAVWLRQLMGELYGYMGASDLGWQYRRAAMRDVGELADRTRAYSTFTSSAIVAFAEQRPRVAAALIDEALAVSAFDLPYEAVEAHLWRSRIRLALGDRQRAREDFLRAAAWFPRSGPVGTRWLAADLSLVRGSLATDATVATQAFSKSIEDFRRTGDLYRVPGALLARAQAHLRAGRLSDADDDLRQAALLNEEQRGRGYPQLLWSAPLDQLDRISDERVRLALDGGRLDDAFDVAETGRARALRAAPRESGSRQGGATELLRLSDIRSRLEPSTTMLFFSVLGDRVLLWRIERHRSSLTTLSISPRELARRVSSFETDLQVGAWTSGTREMAMRLYASLILPAGLDKGSLVVVPDGELHRLPFAALIDPATGRFLIEARTLMVAPSATAYVVAKERSRAWGSTPPVDAVVVGDPYVSPRLFPGLGALPAARDEARAVAALYPQRELLLGAAATRAAFVASLDKHQIAHFAGHAVINRANPDRSSLPLADDGSSDGAMLFGTEIAGLELTNMRAIVLSGCETGGGTLLDGEGSLSLARAFLAAGAPNVVASLWPIPDGPSAPFMTAVHQGIRKGERPANALRSAQLAALRSGDRARRSPSLWASFQVYGG